MGEAQWQNSRQIVERIFVRGTLVLDTPAQFGGTGAEGTTDMPLLYDPRTGTTPLLTGASIAGALRAYLREYERGFEWAEDPARGPQSLAENLFGHLDDKDDQKRVSVLSWLTVDDALGEIPTNAPVEFRDGVAIDPATRTVMLNEQGRGQKYDMELLSAGTTFDLSFELGLTSETRGLLEALVVALRGLEKGQIALGRRKRRGLGECHAQGWRIARYDMNTLDGVMGWLRHNDKSYGAPTADITALLGTPSLEDSRHHFSIQATFALDSSLLVRSYTGERDAPDMVHLRTWREGEERPVLPGTSLAGAIRARALRIAKTVHDSNGEALVESIFGKRVRGNDQKPTGSRIVVRERLVQNSVMDRVQSRVKIDRFTGGSYPQALFDQMPLWGKADGQSTLEVELLLRRSHDATKRDDARIGLLLLVLKDLWTGDLPLGGESSVGRGRLRGETATIREMSRDGKKEWTITQLDNALAVSDPDELEQYVQAFVGGKGE